MFLFTMAVVCFTKDNLQNRKSRKISQQTHSHYTTSPFSALIYFTHNQEQSQSAQEVVLPKNFKQTISICSNKISMEQSNTQETNVNNYVSCNSLQNYTLIKEYLYPCILDGQILHR